MDFSIGVSAFCLRSVFHVSWVLQSLMMFFFFSGPVLGKGFYPGSKIDLFSEDSDTAAKRKAGSVEAAKVISRLLFCFLLFLVERYTVQIA
jgi:hypothetical protein